MIEVLDANSFRAGIFAVAVFVMVVAWRRERILLDRLGANGRRVLWPTCWLLIGAVYAAMALALGFDLSTSLGGLGRDIARNEEWYESRRPLQAVVVSTVGIVWLTIIVIGIWRVPERRRRYLPSALLCVSLVCFAIIRVVSLHHVDRVLARSAIAGVPFGTAVELAGIVVAMILVLRAIRRPIHDSSVESTAVESERI